MTKLSLEEKRKTNAERVRIARANRTVEQVERDRLIARERMRLFRLHLKRKNDICDSQNHEENFDSVQIKKRKTKSSQSNAESKSIKEAMNRESHRLRMRALRERRKNKVVELRENFAENLSAVNKNSTISFNETELNIDGLYDLGFEVLSGAEVAGIETIQI